METQIIIKKNINENLRYGDLTKIRQAVLDNKKKYVSISHVRNVLNPEMNRWDDQVIEEAQQLVIKNQSEVMKAKDRIV